LDTLISATHPSETLAIIARWVRNREQHFVNFCTADVVLRSHDDPALAAIINSSGLAVPDGMPLVWLGRRLSGIDVRRVYGPDMMLEICRHGAELGWRHYFYGGTDVLLRDLVAQLRTKIPTLQVAGVWAPPFRPLTLVEEDEVTTRINNAAPDLVWVGLGTPKQDFWMARFRPKLQSPVLLAVGAAFSFHAGHVPQAPRWMMRLGLEWLFRLCIEPKRLWRRYVIGVPRFLWLVLLQNVRVVQ
jgi:N-acetylglucosaminyldiphosphoundecaprenol N-acetyl-beta-D-mannosaminyltransferase